MLARELRQKYIEFFQSKGHLHQPGAPLVPVDALGNLDNSTLFTSAGMQQYKPYFIGAAVPPATRITTVQKCLRTGDIDSVGDFSHCTFFEMLGNFSFGDYFKAEVIPWTWEFLTQVAGIDPDRLCVTVFHEDDEAFNIWHNVVGLPEDRIHRLGEDKNYWPANAISEGPNGPCGPCTEIFYRVAPLEEMTSDPALTPAERYKIDDAAGRWLEVWNNVFTQFDRQEDENGKAVLVPLPKKNNDTGAGFDRIAYVIQGKRSVFETDLFEPILTRIGDLSGKRYGGSAGELDFAFRVVAEHTRSMVFCIADGILPSNEGRGYVLRRIMRRAIRFGKTALGFDDPFIHEVAPKVIEQMGDFYPELVDRREHILMTIRAEEERFHRTLDNGMRRLAELLGSDEVKATKTLSGEETFTLYDTFGFPLELTEEIAEEAGVKLDREGFGKALEEQRARSRAATEIAKEVFGDTGAALAELQRGAEPTAFLGYGQLSAEAKIVGIVSNGELVGAARAGDIVEVVLDRTPFYAESGGQVGDTGHLVSLDGAKPFRVEVTDTHKAGGFFLHQGKVVEGDLMAGQAVKAAVDPARRFAIRRNHTSTHLLQAALRDVLGTHVHQKGSLVSPERLRFDFTHTQPVSADELARIEDIVNARILQDTEVHVDSDVPIAEAKARGAMALFGEKYGDRVRVVQVPGFSTELCGGTHLDRTSQAGLFKIVSETGVAAGVRRIEAVTGAGAYDFVSQRENTLNEIAHLLKSNPRDVLVAVEKLVAQRSQLEKQVQQLKSGAFGDKAELKVTQVDGVTVVTGGVPDADQEALAAVADRAAQKHASAVIALGGTLDGKVVFVAKVTPDLVKRGFHAGNLVREVAKLAGGGGGGRPDFAQAGGRDPGKLDEALGAVPELVSRQVK